MRISWQDLLDFFFPPQKLCPLCGEFLEESNLSICKTCLGEIEFLPLTPHWQTAALAIYSGILKKAIHDLKYKNQEKLAQPLGALLAQCLGNSLGKVEGIIPIPLHENRLRQRGFNQALLLSQVLGENLAIPVLSDVLLRVKDTVTQVNLSKEQRLKNLTNAFQVINPAKINSKCLLLIDDVYTTGVTTLEAKKVLLAAGAKEVKILTLARGKI